MRRRTLEEQVGPFTVALLRWWDCDLRMLARDRFVLLHSNIGLALPTHDYGPWLQPVLHCLHGNAAIVHSEGFGLQKPQGAGHVSSSQVIGGSGLFRHALKLYIERRACMRAPMSVLSSVGGNFRPMLSSPVPRGVSGNATLGRVLFQRVPAC